MRILAASVWIGERENAETVLVNEILKFEKTERGQWLKANSYRPLECSDLIMDVETFAYKVAVWAWLSEQNLTFYTLKWR
jgi:hypothetical protein